MATAAAGQGQGQGWDEEEEVAICRRELGLAMDLHDLPARVFSSSALISTFYYYTTFGRLDTAPPRIPLSTDGM